MKQVRTAAASDEQAVALPKKMHKDLTTTAATYQAVAEKPYSDPARVRARRRLCEVILGARAAGWGWGHLAEATGMSRQHLAAIIERQTTDVTPRIYPQFVPPETVKAQKERLRTERARRKAHLTNRERARIQELLPDAREMNGSKLIGSPEQVAAEQLIALFEKARERGVSWPEIDEACGYRPDSARIRMRRYRQSMADPDLQEQRRTHLKNAQARAAAEAHARSHLSDHELERCSKLLDEETETRRDGRRTKAARDATTSIGWWLNLARQRGVPWDTMDQELGWEPGTAQRRVRNYKSALTRAAKK